MKRAFVGFSSCIGFNYKNAASRTNNDQQSSPNPVLYGSMGLFVLYDEIWFACKSLCPESMRNLPYVKFLDEHVKNMPIDEGFNAFVEQMTGDFALVRQFLGNERPTIFHDVPKQFLGQGVDNHTHSLTVFGERFTGNADDRHLAIDLAILEIFSASNLEIVLNPATCATIYSPFGYRDTSGEAIRYSNMELADRLLTFPELFDYIASEGPYHPAIEEIRNDQLLIEFRKWVSGNQTKLDNTELSMIETDVNHRLSELRRKSLEKYVERKSFLQVPAQMLKSVVLGLLPPANGIEKAIEVTKHNRKVSELRWQAYIALSRDRLAVGVNRHPLLR